MSYYLSALSSDVCTPLDVISHLKENEKQYNDTFALIKVTDVTSANTLIETAKGILSLSFLVLPCTIGDSQYVFCTVNNRMLDSEEYTLLLLHHLCASKTSTFKVFEIAAPIR